MIVIHHERWGYLIDEKFPANWDRDISRAKGFASEEEAERTIKVSRWAKPVKDRMKVININKRRDNNGQIEDITMR